MADPIRTWPVVRLVASTVTFILTIFAAPAKAQTSGEVGVTGHVAPRCWVVNDGTQSGISTEPRTLCNHGIMTMRSNRRTLQTEVALTIEPKTASENMLALPVQEFTVSPRL